jgi:histidinol phosphatase-like PHP family hydrolase
VQVSPHSRWGYKRAASAVLNLERPIEDLVAPDGTLRKTPHIGPSSTRVILEVLQYGESPTVERAVAESPRAADVLKSRRLRERFLSRARAPAVLHEPSLGGPRLSDYRGDLQMHSTWSDGADPLERMAEACLERGYSFCAITDHSYGLPIARGVSMDDLARQHREIDAANRRFGRRFHILKGIEANIRADGTVDMTPDELAELELVVASPHSGLRSREDQTARMRAAVSAAGVHILGHPRGRMAGSRPGVTARWAEVFDLAARLQVAIEIDGDPARQDLDWSVARIAVGAGCLFALDSDAHSAEELHYAETALAHARLAGVPPDRIVNCWPLDRVIDWASARRSRQSTATAR